MASVSGKMPDKRPFPLYGTNSFCRVLIFNLFKSTYFPDLIHASTMLVIFRHSQLILFLLNAILLLFPLRSYVL